MRWASAKEPARKYLRRFGTRRTVASDVKAGVVLGVESVPDGLAAGVLAGVNPLLGLNAYLVGTVTGALTTGSVFMTVQATGAMSVIVSDVPSARGPQSATVIATLTVLTGVVMLGLGVARLGSLVRFIPSAVLYGFVNGVAINIVLGQLTNFTGFAGVGGNRVTRALDTAAHVTHFNWATVAVGSATIALVFAFEALGVGPLGLVLSVIAGSVLAAAFPADSVATLGDSVDVGRTLPTLVAPSLSAVPALIVPAVSLALVGLVQGAAVSGSIPNPNGRYPDASADFRGQGLANIASGLLRGMPVGGSMSATSLSRSAGARSALAGPVAGAVMVTTVLVCGPLIESVAMPALAGLLILVGVRTLKPHQFRMVWQAGRVQVSVFSVTFALTLTIPLQYAVLSGVGLAIILHVVQQSNRVRIVRWTFETPESRPSESMPPAELVAGDTLVLAPYGTLFFASAQAFRAQLPTPEPLADDAVVVIRLRGTDELGVTFLTMLGDYARELARANATLMVSGVDEDLAAQLVATGLYATIGADNIFRRRNRLGDSVFDALDAIEERRRSG
ncbi:hypothetical protein L5G32_12250 [Gordonia sp. HY002]|uniref:SulP family inorganic anion transporter n=1 Tax=Gordonia zhenghanii TaxID=2911516 RepID=UPI001EEFF0AD|nr:SulP family inorganic anion transporter [Gordonia zhenghanii]MCF8571040.1 hypothetical protein [Gordonia zhenghanii]MCF8606384.1 hypothetical protein [Gordonia zhenghanii]